MSLPIPGRMPPRFKPLADLLDGHMVNAKVLSARWSTSTQTLANWRSTGKGLPAVSLAEGAVRYRISEILAAELAGARGPLSVETVALELSVMPDVPEALAVKIVERLRAVMTDPARIGVRVATERFY